MTPLRRPPSELAHIFANPTAAVAIIKYNVFPSHGRMHNRPREAQQDYTFVAICLHQPRENSKTVLHPAAVPVLQNTILAFPPSFHDLDFVLMKSRSRRPKDIWERDSHACIHVSTAVALNSPAYSLRDTRFGNVHHDSLPWGAQPFFFFFLSLSSLETHW